MTTVGSLVLVTMGSSRPGQRSELHRQTQAPLRIDAVAAILKFVASTIGLRHAIKQSAPLPASRRGHVADRVVNVGCIQKKASATIERWSSHDRSRRLRRTVESSVARSLDPRGALFRAFCDSN